MRQNFNKQKIEGFDLHNLTEDRRFLPNTKWPYKKSFLVSFLRILGGFNTQENSFSFPRRNTMVSRFSLPVTSIAFYSGTFGLVGSRVPKHLRHILTLKLT